MNATDWKKVNVSSNRSKYICLSDACKRKYKKYYFYWKTFIKYRLSNSIKALI